MSATDQPKATRGTSNSNNRGSAADRLARRQYLVNTYRANVDIPKPTVAPLAVPELLYGVFRGSGLPACRCYRCGVLLTVETVTVDRIIPGRDGGTYRRNNIRPACGRCNSSTGALLARHPKRATR